MSCWNAWEWFQWLHSENKLEEATLWFINAFNPPRYSIEGDACEDAVCSFLCPSCTLCQLANELQYHGAWNMWHQPMYIKETLAPTKSNMDAWWGIDTFFTHLEKWTNHRSNYCGCVEWVLQCYDMYMVYVKYKQIVTVKKCCSDLAFKSIRKCSSLWIFFSGKECKISSFILKVQAEHISSIDIEVGTSQWALLLPFNSWER